MEDDWGGGGGGVRKSTSPLVEDDWGRVRESISPWWRMIGGVSGNL